MNIRRTAVSTIADLRRVLKEWPPDAPVFLSNGTTVVVEIQVHDDNSATAFLDRRRSLPSRLPEEN